MEADKVKFIAVGAGKRMALLPDAPTVAESGLPGYEAVSWFGLFGPAGMPADVVTKINAEVRKRVRRSRFQEELSRAAIFRVDRRLAGGTDRHQGRGAEMAKVIEDAKVKGE